MSYDYTLGKGDALMGLEGFMESTADGVIATEEVLKASITNLFPSMRWNQSMVRLPDASESVMWFGEPDPPGAPVCEPAAAACPGRGKDRCCRPCLPSGPMLRITRRYCHALRRQATEVPVTFGDLTRLILKPFDNQAGGNRSDTAVLHS